MTLVRSTVAGALRPARQAAAERGGAARLAAVVAIALVAVGLFTASWDRLGNVGVAGYNVKIPALAFSIAAIAAIPGLWSRRRTVFAPRIVRVLGALVVLIVVVLVLAGAASAHPASALAQIFAVLSGAILPAAAIIGVVRSRADLIWALGWFVAGAAFACTFGVYQLVAFYAGWPQLVDYTGVGVGGGAGRIAAFSYEPAYFANFVILAFGAAASSALLRGRTLGWAPVAGFALVLVLVNVRALYFLVPAVLVLLALRWRQNRRLLLRLVAAGAIAVLLNLAVTQLVTVIAAQIASSPTSSAPAASPDPSSTDDGLAPPAADDGIGSSPSQLLNPNEQSSNAPRLDLYRSVLKVVAAHPALGVGPGNLRDALARVGYVAPNQGAQVVANNIWLQALADGGVVLLAAELALVVTVVVLLFRRRLSPVQPIVAVLLGVLGVSGMLTSYFFDVKVWVALGLIVAAVALLEGGNENEDGGRAERPAS